MARNYHWNIESDGVIHQIELVGRKLFVDNQRVRVGSKNPFLYLVDHPIVLGSKVVNLVIIGNKADLVENGYYLSTHEPYVPIDHAPGWVWAFIAVSIIYPLLVLGGFLGAVIGLFSSMFYMKLSISTTKTSSQKLGLCILVLIATLVVQSILGMIATLLLYAA